jgi:predicted enzyme related to lactoylglutathione lyase
MLEIEVCIDVPELDKGVAFYRDAFGLSKVAEPYPGVAMMKGNGIAITLLEKREQTKPSRNARDVRHYDRHWTPVHLDFHVDDLRGALERAVKAGATQEQLFESDQHGSIAFCADPFGHGFCLLQRVPK